jgi:hypothetical protein
MSEVIVWALVAFGVGMLLDMGLHYRIQRIYFIAMPGSELGQPSFSTRLNYRHALILIAAVLIGYFHHSRTVSVATSFVVTATVCIGWWAFLAFDSMRELRRDGNPESVIVAPPNKSLERTLEG